MQVVEQFVSINGEGKRAGQLALFVRFAGCNLKCEYCDTKWANEKDVPYDSYTAQDLYNQIKERGVTNVTLTGGEPLLQKLHTVFYCVDKAWGFTQHQRVRVGGEGHSGSKAAMFVSQISAGLQQSLVADVHTVEKTQGINIFVVHRSDRPKTFDRCQFAFHHVGKGQKLTLLIVDTVSTFGKIAGKGHSVAAALFLLFR